MNFIDFSNQPALCYETDAQAEAYLANFKNSEYYNQVHLPICEILRINSLKIIGNLTPMTLFDLGPGYPDKAMSLCCYRQKNYHYVAIDINERFLNLAVQNMRLTSLSISGLKSLFEEVVIDSNTVFTEAENNLVMLGLTFMNFDPIVTKSIFGRFSNVAKKFCVAAKLVKHRDEFTLNPYRSEEARQFAFGPLRNQGAEMSDFKYSVEYSGQKLITVFEAMILIKLGNECYPSGTKFITTSSSRYNSTEYREAINNIMSNAVSYYSDDGLSVVTVGEI